MQRGTRVTFLVEDNKTFLLPTVERAIEALKAKGFDVTRIGVVPQKLRSHSGWAVSFWYLRVFGLIDTVLLAAYSTLESVRRLRARFGPVATSVSWNGLAGKFGLECRRLQDPNSASALEFLRSGPCDILFIMVPYVLRQEVLAVPLLGTINKHAAVLPGCRGLFPYIWSIIHKLPLGVTFHAVIPKVDAGPVLLQRRVDPRSLPRSMVQFYIWVFRVFPEMAVEAADRLVARSGTDAPDREAGPYFSLPSRADYCAFRAAGGRVIRVPDLFRSLVRP